MKLLKNKTNLIFLDLSRNYNISNIEEILVCKNIEYLNLNDTQIPSFRPLTALTNLRHLYLDSIYQAKENTNFSSLSKLSTLSIACVQCNKLIVPRSVTNLTLQNPSKLKSIAFLLALDLNWLYINCVDKHLSLFYPHLSYINLGLYDFLEIIWSTRLTLMQNNGNIDYVEHDGREY